MANNDPRSAVKSPQAPAAPIAGSTKKPLSYADAEMFASRIRPSWELVDDAARADLAGDLDVKPAAVVTMGGDPPYPPAQPAGSKPASDTVIQGVPTLSVGLDVPVEAPVAKAEAPKAEAPKAEAPKQTTNGAAHAAPAKVEAEPPPPPRVAKTLDGEDPAPPPPARPSPTLIDEEPKAKAKSIPPEPAKPAAPPAKAAVSTDAASAKA